MLKFLSLNAKSRNYLSLYAISLIRLWQFFYFKHDLLRPDLSLLSSNLIFNFEVYDMLFLNQKGKQTQILNLL